jgi:hypothetical protein
MKCQHFFPKSALVMFIQAIESRMPGLIFWMEMVGLEY